MSGDNGHYSTVKLNIVAIFNNADKPLERVSRFFKEHYDGIAEKLGLCEFDIKELESFFASDTGSVAILISIDGELLSLLENGFLEDITESYIQEIRALEPIRKVKQQ